MKDQVTRKQGGQLGHEAQTLLLLVAYGLQMLKPTNRNCETSAPSISRLREPLGQQMSAAFGNMRKQVWKTQKPWGEAPALAHVACSLAPRVLLAPTTGQASCQVRNTWMRDTALPQWLLRQFQGAQGLLGAWTCLVLGKMAGRGLKLHRRSKKTRRLLFLELAAEVEPRAWTRFVSQEHRTNGRACSYYKGLGAAEGEDLAPLKDFPHEHQRINKGGFGRRTKVDLGMLALPQRHFLCIFLCWESNPETPMIMILIFITVLLFRVGSVFLPRQKAFEWR